MRIGKPGKWWVLRRADIPVFWTGEVTQAFVEGQPTPMPVFVLDKWRAQQFADRAAALMMHSIFGLSSQIEPVELEFTA